MTAKIKFIAGLLSCAIAGGAIAAKNPGSGKTLLMVGQTYQQEYIDYTNATGSAPAGSSHYGTIYSGTIEQGDDQFNNQFMSYIENSYPGAYALVALSFKDNFAAGGFGSTIDGVRAVGNGQFNGQLDAIANIMKSRPNTHYFLRIGYEVSLGVFQDAQAFKDTYNYVANRIRNVNGVSNVDFVYHPVRFQNDVQSMYPGDQYVDWFGLSVFANDVCMPTGGIINCPGNRVDRDIDTMFDWARNKGIPVMIAESTVQAPAASNNSDFIEYLTRLDELVRNDDVQALVYINSNWPAKGWDPQYWGDSRIEKNSTTLNFWNDRFVNGDRYLSYADLGQPNGNEKPTVTVSANSVQAPNPLTMTANASDVDGNIQSVAFYATAPGDSESLIATDTNAPYSATIASTVEGTYQIRAVATDNEGATAQSTGSVIVTGSGQGNQPTEIKVEAESGSATSPARIYNDSAASGGTGIAYIYQQNAGFTIENAPKADSLLIRFASQNSGTISVYVDGNDYNINFTGNGTWVGNYKNVEAQIDIPQGATVKVQFDNGDAALNVDYLIFKNSGGNIVKNTPPEVSIQSINGDLTENGFADVEISATDKDGTVTGVELFATASNGSETSLGTDTTAPYNFRINDLVVGQYQLRVVATDDSGDTSSARDEFEVTADTIENQSPTVNSLVLPSGLKVGDNLTVSATASDLDGSVESIAFYVTPPNGSEYLADTDYSAPYGTTIENLQEGSYIVRAVATDNAGATGERNGTTTVAPVNTGGDFVFGIESDGTVYHKDGGQTGGFVYLCLNGACYPAQKNGDRYQISTSATNGTHNIEYKIQDNATGQCLFSASAVAPGSGVKESDCD